MLWHTVQTTQGQVWHSKIPHERCKALFNKKCTLMTKYTQERRIFKHMVAKLKIYIFVYHFYTNNSSNIN